jgi:hypothetical protein
VTKQPPQIEMRLEGPAVPGRISVDALAALPKQLQTSLRSILSNRRQSIGRFRDEVEQVCKLDLIAFKPGSAVMLFEYAPPRDTGTLQGDQGAKVADELFAMLEAGEQGHAGWSDSLTSGVLDGFDRLTRGLGEGVDAMELSLRHLGRTRSVRVTSAFRSHLRKATATPERAGEVKVEGVVWEIDWKNRTAELWEANGTKVKLSFSQELEERITESKKRRVRVHGQRTGLGGQLREVSLTRIEPLEDVPGQPDPAYGSFRENLSIDELAQRQGVGITQSIEALRSDWLDNESVDDFLDVIRDGRS